MFLVWLFLPNFNGASIIYDILISNHLKKVETIVDKKRLSDSLIEPISTETIKLNEKVIAQPTTPIKVNNESTNSSEKKVNVPIKTAADLLMEKKNN